MKEEVFWRNYFYRVSLIKQSAQLTALAAQQQAAERREDDKNGADPQSENTSGSVPISLSLIGQIHFYNSCTDLIINRLLWYKMNKAP